MKCPICATRLHPGSERCPGCGYRMPASPPASSTPPLRPEPRSRRGCLWVPPSLLLVLLLLSAAVSFVRGVRILSGSGQIISQAPVPEPPASAPAEETVTIPAMAEDCFIIEDGQLVFLPGEWDSPILRVPETVDGMTVTGIAPGCFRDCTALTTVLLPDTLTQIGREAFAGCTNLRGLYVPDGTETIGRDAFAGCVSLESVYIPATVEFIAGGCFDDCARLLYIFYDGDFERWHGLCDDYITPFTTAICHDGNYYHGAGG